MDTLFVNWNTKGDGTGKSYAPGATYSTDANLTLYAIWKTNASGGPVTKKNTLLSLMLMVALEQRKRLYVIMVVNVLLTGNAFY